MLFDALQRIEAEPSVGKKECMEQDSLKFTLKFGDYNAAGGRVTHPWRVFIPAVSAQTESRERLDGLGVLSLHLGPGK